MHPFQVGAVAQHRIAGLREDAAEHRRAATAPPARRVLIRHRAGWILIHVGLRLAISPADPARNTTCA
jgi:hypothetical protein